MFISSCITCMHGSFLFSGLIKILSFCIDFFLNLEAYVFLSFLCVLFLILSFYFVLCVI